MPLVRSLDERAVTRLLTPFTHPSWEHEDKGYLTPSQANLTAGTGTAGTGRAGTGRHQEGREGG